MSIRSSWQEYLFNVHVLPRDVPSVQVTECRRAFYAGAWSVLTQAIEDEGGQMLELLAMECEEFNRAVKEGKA